MKTSKRQQRIEQIHKLEIKQQRKWHNGIQQRIERLKFLTGYRDLVTDGDRPDETPELQTGPIYVEPTKRLAGEYAAYLGSGRVS